MGGKKNQRDNLNLRTGGERGKEREEGGKVEETGMHVMHGTGYGSLRSMPGWGGLIYDFMESNFCSNICNVYLDKVHFHERKKKRF